MNRAVRYSLVGVLIAAPLWLSLVALRSAPPPETQPPAQLVIKVEPAEGLSEFAGYRQWAKVNPKPQYLASKLDLLCIGPSPEQLAEEAKNPHIRKFMQCYVNPIGEEAMLHQKHPVFPVGSVILKEKLPEVDSSTPILLTAMVKHAQGYAPTHGDWEFVVMDGDGKHVQARGHLANCESCHAEKKNTDYVFRDELSEAQQALLK